MQRTLFFLFSLLLILPWSAFAQNQSSIYMPVNIQSAYTNGTRSYDGRPGARYWQNHSQYSIQAHFGPATNMLSGHESIVYFNESPDTLHRLYMRLYQNIFEKGNLRDWPVDVSDLHDGVELSAVKINGKSVEMPPKPWRIESYGTVIYFPLKEAPLAPGQNIKLELNWKLHIARKSPLRMGTYDSTSFFIGYWYPQMAVYEDIDGWDHFTYSGLQEFYNDFSDYDVQITVPKNYVVWATGRLQNLSEVLQPHIVKRYQSAFKQDEIIDVVTEQDLEAHRVTADNDSNTFHYKAQHVPDFAFALSDHYLWDLTHLDLDTHPTRTVLIGAAYKKSADNFDQVAEIAKKSVLYYSTEMPAVPFPFPSLTVFNGGGGMEYPMMVNEGAPKSWSSTVHVTTHEICHTYFPFMMGINERKYAWMDEGWATMLPFDLQQREAPGYDPIERTIGRYLHIAGSEYDVPMIVPTIVYGANARTSYRNASYNRPGIAYYLLEQMVGKEQFVKIMQEYIRRWQGKHPGPFDFFFTVNDVLGEDLGWFWKPWFYGFGYPDLALKKKQETGKEIIVDVVKKGLLPIPVKLNVLYQDSSKKIIEKPMRVWKDGKKEIEIHIAEEKPILKIELGDAHIPDLNEENNVLEISEVKK